MGKKKKKKSTSPASDSESTPLADLVSLADKAVEVSKKARRNRKSLSGINYYANKLADLRADATNAFEKLSGMSVGDTSALAELMERVFSPGTPQKNRAEAARELSFNVKTKWKDTPQDLSHLEEGGVFPLVTLNQTKRGYLVSVGRQANGCYESGWYDACAVMMRRLLESSIIEAFEAKGIDSKIKDTNGDFLQLTGLINKALAEKSWNLPRNVKKELINLRDVGHRSAHNRYYLAKKPDLDKQIGVYRETVEAFLHLAKLL